MSRRLRLGTRGSRLALIQSRLVAERLRRQGHQVELVTIVTEGDVRPAGTVPGEGMFVSALERALSAGEIDLAVHSAKDVPLALAPGLIVGAHPERSDPRDALVTRAGGSSLSGLAAGAAVGTDSPRRSGFVRAARGDLRPVPFHGNVDSRLRRLDGGEIGVLVLAAAGLDRLGAGTRADVRFDPRLVTPAPGQGALAVQARSEDAEARAALAAIDRPDLALAVAAERMVLEATGGTCRSPVGALATVAGGRLRLLAAAVSPDGSRRHLVASEGEAGADQARALAEAAGAELVRQGVLPA